MTQIGVASAGISPGSRRAPPGPILARIAMSAYAHGRISGSAVEIGIALAVLAAVALAIELSSMTFYLIAVALALAAGSAVALTGAGSLWALTTVALGAAAGLPAAHVARKRLSRATHASEGLNDPDAGHLVRVESVAPEGLRVAYRNSSWTARLIDPYRDLTVSPGDLLTIVHREGNDLLLAPPAARASIRQ